MCRILHIMNVSRLAIDIDEVLMPFAKPMSKWRGYKMPTNKHAYVYTDMFNISEKESRSMVKEFYFSDEIKVIKPIPYSRRKLQEFRPKVKKIYAVTGRQSEARDITEEWLQKYFPDIFDDLIITNSYTINEVNKADICRSLDIDVIIDDMYSTCKMCKHAGTNAIHFSGFSKKRYNWCDHNDMSVIGWENIFIN